ncbi:hypothetical protein [Frigoriglobus tundricola]|uniref:hypothetical protein n=1 Tax=Frigoriglobus tundricola TaxID=2774151 RepID=UPI00148EAF53|nr:hypothetical protein [Frigoriglobus tundricola]
MKTRKTAPDPEPVPLTALEERQATLAHMVRMVARGMSNGLIAVGPGGLGKSRIIGQTLAEEGISPIMLNSHCTPLGLYTAMFNHRTDAVLWLDDADAMYTSLPILGLLRSALWGTAGDRVVTYTSSTLSGLPSSFTFTSRIIATANVIPSRNEAFKAVLSRVDTFTLTATNDEILELLRTLARKGYEGLRPELCEEVVEYIARVCGGRQLSVRIYESAMQKVRYALQSGGTADWRDLVRTQLENVGQPADAGLRPLDSKGHDLRCMAIALEKHPENVKLQEEAWRTATGKSRASFFRTKKQYESQLHSDQS